MKHTTYTLAAVAIAAALGVAGCATTPSNAPGAAPSPPQGSSTQGSSTPTGGAQATPLTWAISMCQALHPAFSQLGMPPQPDANDPAATRRAFITYLTNAGNATEQAIDRLPSIGAPPVDNGPQIFNQIRDQLTKLRTNLSDAVRQLQTADPNDAAALGQAIGAAGNLVGLITTLGTNPQLRAAIDQAPECRDLSATNGR